MKISVIANGVKTTQDVSVSNRVSGRVGSGVKAKSVDIHTIPGFTGYYVNIKTGTVYGRQGRSIGSKTPGGYVLCKLRDEDGNLKNMLRSRLVVMAATNSVIAPRMEVDHVNNIKHDDRIENLSLCDHHGNCNNKLTRILANKPRRTSSDKLTITAAEKTAAKRSYRIEKVK